MNKSTHQHKNVLPGPAEGTVLSESGETLTLPEKSIKVLETYRRGRDLDNNCPLKQALDKMARP